MDGYRWIMIYNAIHHLMYIWVCLKMLCRPLYPMVLLIIIPMKNGYFIGKINPTFSDKPISGAFLEVPSGERLHFAMENHHAIFMGKSTISTGPFSIAMLNYQRVYSGILRYTFFGEIWRNPPKEACFGQPRLTTRGFMIIPLSKHDPHLKKKKHIKPDKPILNPQKTNSLPRNPRSPKKIRVAFGGVHPFAGAISTTQRQDLAGVATQHGTPDGNHGKTRGDPIDPIRW